MTTTIKYYGVSLTWDNDFFGYRQPVLWSSDYMEALEVLTKWWRAGVHFRIDSRIEGDDEYEPSNVTGHYYVSDNNGDMMADYLDLLYATLYLGKADKVCFSVTDNVSFGKRNATVYPYDYMADIALWSDDKTFIQSWRASAIAERKKGTTMDEIEKWYTGYMHYWMGTEVMENPWLGFLSIDC